jgi:hypothetical protein
MAAGLLPKSGLSSLSQSGQCLLPLRKVPPLGTFMEEGHGPSGSCRAAMGARADRRFPMHSSWLSALLHIIRGFFGAIVADADLGTTTDPDGKH